MEPQIQTARAIDNDVSLDVSIKIAVSEFLNISGDQIVTQPNKVKYFDQENPLSVDENLQEVFSIMRNLNDRGIREPGLCLADSGGSCFAESLRATVKDFAATVGHQPYHYVELGPEPVKTSAILEELISAGVRLKSYTAIDINPASERVMRSSVSKFIPSNRIQYVTADYFSLGGLNFHDDDTPVLATMLGFQEGNETPQKMMKFFRRVLGRGDMLFAEMQLLPRANWLPVFNFYGNSLMKRFSKIGLKRALGDLRSEYGVVIVPVPLGIPNRGHVAVMTERILTEGEMCGKVFITNYCIKYTAEQFRMVREFDGAFHVLSQQETGDGSVCFQLAERC